MSRNAYAQFPPPSGYIPPHAIPPYGGGRFPPMWKGLDKTLGMEAWDEIFTCKFLSVPLRTVAARARGMTTGCTSVYHSVRPSGLHHKQAPGSLPHCCTNGTNSDITLVSPLASNLSSAVCYRLADRSCSGISYAFWISVTESQGKIALIFVMITKVRWCKFIEGHLRARSINW